MDQLEILTFENQILQAAFAVFAIAMGTVGIALALCPVITSAKTGGGYLSEELITLTSQIINAAYQLGVVIPGLGSLFLCYSFFRSKAIPRFI